MSTYLSGHTGLRSLRCLVSGREYLSGCSVTVDPIVGRMHRIEFWAKLGPIPQTLPTLEDVFTGYLGNPTYGVLNLNASWLHDAMEWYGVSAPAALVFRSNYAGGLNSMDVLVDDVQLMAWDSTDAGTRRHGSMVGIIPSTAGALAGSTDPASQRAR